MIGSATGMVGHPFLRLHLIILAWGCTAILGRLLTVPAVEVVFLRCVIATLALVLWIKLDQRLPSLLRRIEKRIVFQWIGIGGVIGLHWILFFASINLSNVSIATVGLTTSPLWTAVLDPVINRTKFQPRQIVFGIVMLLGIGLIFQTSPAEFASGFSLAIAAGFLGALFTSLNVGYTHHNDPKQITMVQMAGAAGLCAICLPLTTMLEESGKTLGWPSGMDWLWIAILSLVCTVYAFTEFIDLLKQLSPFTIIFANNLEPVYSIALGALLFGDNAELDQGFYIGAAIIVLSVLIQSQVAKVKSRRQFKAGEFVRRSE